MMLMQLTDILQSPPDLRYIAKMETNENNTDLICTEENHKATIQPMVSHFSHIVLSNPPSSLLTKITYTEKSLTFHPYHLPIY